MSADEPFEPKVRSRRSDGHVEADPAVAVPRISLDDVLKVDIRVGRIVSAEPFPQARMPAVRLSIDLGAEIGLRRSSARIAANYGTDELVGRLVLCVVNLPPRQIGPMMSEVLTLGVPDGRGEVTLVAPDRDVPLGGRLY